MTTLKTHKPKLAWGLAALFSLVVLGCVSGLHGLRPITMEPAPHAKTFDAPFESVWAATVSAMGDFPLTNIDKESGLIVTDWKTTPQPFIFVETDGRAYEAQVGSTFQEKRERLNIRVFPSGEGTRVQVTTRVEVFFDNSVIAAAMGGRPTPPAWRSANPSSNASRLLFEKIAPAMN